MDAIEDLERRTLAKDWRDVLQAEFTKDYFIKVHPPLLPSSRHLLKLLL